MKKHLFLFVALVTFATTISAQSDTTRGTFLKPKPRNYEVKHAIEIESLVPMFFYGRVFYIQPGIHSYFRAEQSVNYSNHETYTIPTFELSPVVRIGARLWRKY